MKRLVPLLLLLSTLFAVSPPAAKAAKPPQFNTIVLNHFTNANGVSQSQEFIQEFQERLRDDLRRSKIAQQVLDQGATVTGADAANSLVIEGKFTSLDGTVNKKLTMEIDIYRISDHVLVKTITPHFDFILTHGTPAKPTGDSATVYVRLALQKVNLSSIPAGPPVPTPTAPVPASAAAPAVPQVFASVQIASTPAGAEITIDGNDAGNTPSLVKLRPGTHSIRITMDGYTPWERSIDTGAGESRNLAANLEKTGQ